MAFRPLRPRPGRGLDSHLVREIEQELHIRNLERWLMQRYYRQERTQAQIADELAVAPSTVCAWIKAALGGQSQRQMARYGFEAMHSNSELRELDPSANEGEPGVNGRRAPSSDDAAQLRPELLA